MDLDFLLRKDGELEEEYIYRICSHKDDIGSWYDVADIINENLGYEYTESKYRKQFQAYQKMFGKVGEKESSIREKLDEIYKERVRWMDQRRVYNESIRKCARFEYLTEVIKESIEKMNKNYPLVYTCDRPYTEEDTEAILVLSDIHYGMNCDCIWNKYNTEIAQERIATVVTKSIEHIIFHKVKKLHIILLGDAAHGAIHTTARIKSDEDACDQIVHISEILAQVIKNLSDYVEETYVYSTYGNHLRTVQNKKESVHSDNMEKIIPWYLKARLQNCEDIKIVDSNYYEFIFLDVCGHGIVATHGDLDSIKNIGVVANTLFSKVYGKNIEYTISGDKHHVESFEQLGIESVISPSLCGTDEFANNKRLYSKPGQLFMIFTEEDGKQCTYNISL